MRDQGVYLEHILECIDRVKVYTADGLDALAADRMIQDAVFRNLHVLSESCMRMSGEIRERRKEIDWKGIAAFRNVIVHDYLDIDLLRLAGELILHSCHPDAGGISRNRARQREIPPASG